MASWFVSAHGGKEPKKSKVRRFFAPTEKFKSGDTTVPSGMELVMFTQQAAIFYGGETRERETHLLALLHLPRALISGDAIPARPHRRAVLFHRWCTLAVRPCGTPPSAGLSALWWRLTCRA